MPLCRGRVLIAGQAFSAKSIAHPTTLLLLFLQSLAKCSRDLGTSPVRIPRDVPPDPHLSYYLVSAHSHETTIRRPDDGEAYRDAGDAASARKLNMPLTRIS
jgi:hypothetical protein